MMSSMMHVGKNIPCSGIVAHVDEGGSTASMAGPVRQAAKEGKENELAGNGRYSSGDPGRGARKRFFQPAWLTSFVTIPDRNKR